MRPVAQHIFDAGGKRLRPLLTVLTARLCGYDNEDIYDLAVTLEMLHAATLLHDDVLDNAATRRGQPAAHTLFEVTPTILAGDALLTNAFSHMTRANVPVHVLLEAVRLTADAAGAAGMVGGQMLDLQGEGKKLSLEELRILNEKKTGALIEAALMMGAVCAGAGEETVELMERIGRDIGLAFQIRDDILDVISTSSELGKSAHADDRNAKITWVTFYGLEQSEKDVRRFTDRAIENLASIGEDEFFEELLRQLIDRSF